MDVGWSYRLTADEVTHAERVAHGAIKRSKQRQRRGYGKGERDGGSSREKTRFDRNANGFAAEIAVARLFGDDDWLPVIVDDSFCDPPDAGGRCEVRQTDRHSNRLIIYPRDKNEAPYVLVTGTRHDVMYARGWLYGTEGKRPDFWDESVPNPNYFIPQAALHPMEDLL